MNLFRAFIGTILITTAGALAMCWPLAVMACLIAVALVGVALDRYPIEPNAHNSALQGELPATSSEKKPVVAPELLKAA